MITELHGKVHAPALVMAGTWDPLTEANLLTLSQAAAAARRSGLASLAVLITPSPGVFSFGRTLYPTYSHQDARVRLILRARIDAVLTMRFTRKEFEEKSVDDFLDRVSADARVAELWLGAKQTLGHRHQGGSAAIARAVLQRGIRLRRLPPDTTHLDQMNARDHLREGRVEAARAMVGNPPVLARPRAGRRIRLAWTPGEYAAVPVGAPGERPMATPLRVAVEPAKGGMSALEWPDRSIRWLAFLRGPNDGVAAAGPGALMLKMAAGGD